MKRSLRGRGAHALARPRGHPDDPYLELARSQQSGPVVSAPGQYKRRRPRARCRAAAMTVPTYENKDSTNENQRAENDADDYSGPQCRVGK